MSEAQLSPALYVEKTGLPQGADGASPVLLMLHGWGHSHVMTQDLAKLLGDKATLYLFDLPGHGQSAAPGDDWGTAQYAERILAWCDEHEIEHFSLFGHSFGGKISVWLAAHYPERVDALILLNASGLRRRRTFKRKLSSFYLKLLRSLVKCIDRAFAKRYFEDWFVPRYASADYKNAGPLRQSFVKIVNEDFSDICAKIRAKTLLLWGELDSETPLELGRRYEQLIPDSRLVVLKGKDHHAHLGSSAHVCAQHIRAFWQSQQAADLAKDSEAHGV